jgi:hypothetical protein
VLECVNLARVVHDQTNSDNLTTGPVFDTYVDDLNDQPVFAIELVHDRVAIAVFDQGSDDFSIVRTSIVLPGGPLFDDELEIEEAEIATNQDLLISTDIATPATTVDTSLTCSMKCLHIAVNTGRTLVT